MSYSVAITSVHVGKPASINADSAGAFFYIRQAAESISDDVSRLMESTAVVGFMQFPTSQHSGIMVWDYKRLFSPFRNSLCRTLFAMRKDRTLLCTICNAIA